MTPLERRLAALCGRKQSVFTASGSSALVLVFEWLRKRYGAGEVIVPAITCPAVAQAVLYAGHVPVFADVVLPDATIDVRHARTLVTGRTRAIVPIHIFGHAAPMDDVAALTTGRNIAVVEDAAQAIGGSIGSRAAGSFGTFSIVSFSATKIIDAGAGGGILLDDADAAADLRDAQNALPVIPYVRLRLLELSQRNFYHALTDALRTDANTNVSQAFNAMLPAYRDIYLRRLDGEEAVAQAVSSGLDGLDGALKHRRAIAELYAESFGALHGQVRISEAWRTSGTIWRYTLLFSRPEDAISVTEELRRSGLPASNHYWSVARLVSDLALPQADRFSRHVVNLWVDSSVDRSAALQTAAVIKRVLMPADAAQGSPSRAR